MTQTEARALVVELAFERSDLDNLLELSGGTKGEQDEKVWRSYWVAAKLWATSKKGRLIKGKGAEFESIEALVRRLLAMQLEQDGGLTIPPGYEADPCKLIPCEGDASTGIPSMAWSGSVETIRTF